MKIFLTAWDKRPIGHGQWRMLIYIQGFACKQWGTSRCANLHFWRIVHLHDEISKDLLRLKSSEVGTWWIQPSLPLICKINGFVDFAVIYGGSKRALTQLYVK